MEFSAKEDIEAPLDQDFAEISDFEKIERSAMRHGIEVERKEGGGTPAEGTIWTSSFGFRGKPRTATSG